MMNNTMTKEILIHKTFDYLNRLPQDKVIEVAEFGRISISETWRVYFEKRNSKDDIRF